MKSHSVAALALVCLSMVALGSALSFDSAPNQIKCFRENLARHQVVSGDVSTVSSPFMQLKFWIENPYKRTVYNAEDVGMGTKFSFAADVDGEYKLCFADNARMNAYNSNMPRRVTLNYKSDDDKGKDVKVANKQGLKPLEAELLRIEQVAMHVSAESDHQREREATHRDTSETLNSRVAWYSMLSLIVLGGLSVFQVFVIQRYLKKTKWID